MHLLQPYERSTSCVHACMCTCVSVLGQIGQSRDEATSGVSCNDVTHTRLINDGA